MIKTLRNYNPEKQEYDEGLPLPEHLEEDINIEETEINHYYIEYDCRSFKTIRGKKLHRKAYETKQIQFNFMPIRKGKKNKEFRNTSFGITRSGSIFC